MEPFFILAAFAGGVVAGFVIAAACLAAVSGVFDEDLSGPHDDYDHV